LMSCACPFGIVAIGCSREALVPPPNVLCPGFIQSPSQNIHCLINYWNPLMMSFNHHQAFHHNAPVIIRSICSQTQFQLQFVHTGTHTYRKMNWKLNAKLCWSKESSVQVHHHFQHQFYLSRNKTEHGAFVLIIEPSMTRQSKISSPFQW